MSVAGEVELLLEAWERGQGLSPPRRALMLHAFARPGMDARTLAAQPVGRRNRALIELRRRWFGSVLVAYTECPWCRQRLELRLNAEDLLAADQTGAAEERGRIERYGYIVEFRTPTSADLLEIESEVQIETASRALLSSCVLKAAGPDGEIAAERLPATLLEELQTRMTEMDALAETLVNLSCAECGRHWIVPLDIPSFLWREVSAKVRQVLMDVDALARAYGWSEREILAMSEYRRNCYLELLGT